MTYYTYLRCVLSVTFCLCMVFFTYVQAQNQKRQPGAHRILIILDKETGKPVDGSIVLIENQLIVSDSDGRAFISEAVLSTDTVRIQNLGYQPQQISLKELFREEKEAIVYLHPEVRKLDEVVVSGVHAGASRNAVGSQLSSAEIDRALGTSLASLLEQVSGVSSISTGTTVAKPVIQGMYGNRILIINNGARQTGQQWGADHAPEVDMNSSGSIRVIKGSDAVRYGSEALGGIILMEQAPLPYRGRTLKGKASALYGSNGHRYVLTGQAEGAFPLLTDLAWRVQGTYSNGGDRSTAHYLLNNTGTREQHVSASLGYDRGNLRTEGFYSRFHTRMGVMLSAQMGSEDLLAERIRLGRPIHIDPFTRSITYPSQYITHQTAVAKLRFDAKRAGTFFWQGSWQKDDRQENRVRRLGSEIPAVSLHLSSLQNFLSWKWNHRIWQTEVGGQVLFVDNHSQSGTGIVPVIPNYTETQMGGYAIEKFTYNKGGAEVGVRFDRQETRADGYDWTGSRYGGTRTFNNVSYTVGAHHRFTERWQLTTNLGLSWRAPHVYELYSNGNELGSGMFVRGDSAMHSEKSYKWISSLGYNGGGFNIRVDGYLQWVSGYIYDEPQKETITVISGVYPVFQYKQTRAFFRGMDLDVRWALAPAWHYHLTASFIRANERTTGNYLPYIPSFRFGHELAWERRFKSTFRLHLNIRHRFVAKQTRFDPDTDLIPYTPPAYHLLGLDTAFEWPVKHGNRIRVTLSADNLLNKEYKEYTNRSRYYAHDIGRDVRCGISWSF